MLIDKVYEAFNICHKYPQVKQIENKLTFEEAIFHICYINIQAKHALFAIDIRRKEKRMKKSTIWLLATVMAFAFAGLLYLQVNYVSIIMKTRSEQFNETVKRSMLQVSKSLELDETKKYLEDDINRGQHNFMYRKGVNSASLGQIINEEKYQLQITDSNGGVQQIELQSFSSQKFTPRSALSQQPTNDIITTSKDLQQTLKRRYQYQGGLIEEVIYNILHTANLKPIQERVDFKKLNNYLKTEFINNGLNLPFIFTVINKDGNVVFQCEDTG